MRNTNNNKLPYSGGFICPRCGSYRNSYYVADGPDFNNDGTGHMTCDCECNDDDCGILYSAYITFKITDIDYGYDENDEDSDDDEDDYEDEDDEDDL